MYYHTHRAVGNEVDLLYSLDVNCFYHPWTRDMWQESVMKHDVRIAMLGSDIVGYWSGVRCRLHTYQFRLLRLGVLPKFRLQGFSRTFMQQITLICLQYGGLTEIRSLIPEVMTYSSREEFILPWLTKSGFKATGKVARGLFSEHDEPLDGFEFVHQLGAKDD